MIRFSRACRILAGVLLTLPLSACAASTIVRSEATDQVLKSGRYSAAPPSTVSLAAPTDRHVVIISIDGLRPEAIEAYAATTLQRLIREGSHSLQARTIVPSRTLPSHTSMITGVEPRTHGITWNDNRVEDHGAVTVPTIFSTARAEGLRTAAFFSKGKFAHLVPAGSVDYAMLPKGDGNWLAGRTAGEVQAYLETSRPNLLFVHFGEPDYAGHLIGWMSMPYGWAVRRADRAVARVLDDAEAAFGKGNFTVIVTADHGGHGRGHGTETEADMTIPWIAWGAGVRKGAVLPGGIHTTDTAATALWLLGIAEPTSYAGVPVLTALEAPFSHSPALTTGTR